MLVTASSFVIVIFSLLFSTTQAFFTAPVPGFVHGLTIYDINEANKRIAPETAVKNNEVRIDEAEREDNDQDDDDDEEDRRRAIDPEVNERDGRQTVVVVEFESELNEKDDEDGNKTENDVSSADSENQSPLDPWSIVWYIGSFGGLVAFFLIVSCSEWCCRRGARPINSTYGQRGANDQASGRNGATETPPPPYHLFAPPPYDSVNYGDLVDKTSGEKIDIFVISVPVQSTAHQPAPA